MIAHNVQGSGPQVRPSNESSPSGPDPSPDEVRAQLQRILASSVFHNSKRYAAVLRFVVDQTLQGYGDRLKERTIGIEVFDRPPDYDTATDHVVRSAVAEVRKRLAQYYQQEGRGELRIEVLPGSYMPQFKWAEDHPAVAPASTANPEPPEGAAAASAPQVEPVHRPWWLRTRWIIAACAILVISVAAFVSTEHAHDALDRFWNPILSSRSPVLLCIGNVEGGRRPPEVDPVLSPTLSLSNFHNSPSETVNVHDAFTVAKFAGFLESHGRQFQLASQSDATYTDLQNGPTILVGLLNNGWTVRLLQKLRFTVDQPTVDKIKMRHENTRTMLPRRLE